MLIRFYAATQRSAPEHFLRSALAALLLASIIGPPLGLCQTYTTRFEGDENPLSEGGRWSNGGLDWTNICKGRGIAYLQQRYMRRRASFPQ
jgi:hypothetical protein